MSEPHSQVGGTHYLDGAGSCPKCGTRLQHWDLVLMFGWDYFQGQIIKYVMRWKRKNGIEDLEKGDSFLGKYIEAQRSEEATSAYVNQNGSGDDHHKPR